MAAAHVPTTSDRAAELAVPLSIAVRIEPDLIRAIRLAVLPYLDVAAESDLWFSELVASRGPDSIILEPEILPVLRGQLADRLARSMPADPIRAVWDITKQVHAGVSPALLLEEQVAWLAVSAGDSGVPDIEEELRKALYSLVVEGRTGIADWLAGAWGRFPETARNTRTAWRLRQAASRHIDTANLPLGVIPAGLGVADLAEFAAQLGDAPVGVRLVVDELEIGDLARSSGAAALPTLDTDPRIVELLPERDRPGETLTVLRGATLRVSVGPGPVRLRTPRGLVYDITPLRAVGSSTSASEDTAESDLGQTQRAIGHYQQALAIARETGDRASEGLWLGNLGSCYADLGQTDRAVEHYQQALAIAREIGDRASEGRWLGNLGILYRDLRETGRAAEHFGQALAIAREIGDRRSEGRWLGNLGILYRDLRETGRAAEHFEQALAIAREASDRASEGLWLGNLGTFYRDLGETERAVEFFQQALAIAREAGDRASEGLWLGNLGSCYVDLEETERAVDQYQVALAIGEESRNAQVQAGALLGLAQAHLYQEDWPEARRAAEAAQGCGYQLVLPQALAALGIAYLREGDRTKAGEAFSAAVSAADTLLTSASGPIDVLYAAGIANAGQAMTGNPGAAQTARRAFEQAPATPPLHGVRARTLRQLDLLVAADAEGVLTDVRQILAERLRETG